MNRFGATIGDALGYDGLCTLDPDRVSMFFRLVRDRIYLLSSGQSDADDIRVFVKPEPHTEEKVRQGRFRLISAVSMVDTMIDRMLFGELTRNVLESAGKTPVMIGWVPILGGYRLLRGLLPGRVLCVDKSSWDWTVPYWMTRRWLDIILGLSNGHPPFWETVVRKRFECLFKDAWFRFDDNTRVRQEVPGIMKSGCYLTIVLNSIGQLLVHYMVSAKLGIEPAKYEPFCMGDDTVQAVMPDPESYLEEIGKLGFRVKEAKEQDWIEFAGFYIDRTTWPVYWRKHLFQMQHAGESLPEMLQAYQLLYACEPAMLEYVQGVMREVCPKKILPRSILQNMVTGNVAVARSWVKSHMFKD